MDYKSLVRFINVEYYEEIFTNWVNKFGLYNIYIYHIIGKKIRIANKLS